MDLKKLSTEERAVSPVIGVILMVAITVILAAVIGAFVLGIGGDQSSTPSANLNIEADGTETIAVEHNGGDAIGEVTVTANGSSIDDGQSDELTDLSAGASVSGIDITTGNSEVEENDEGVSTRIVHDESGGVIARATIDLD